VTKEQSVTDTYFRKQKGAWEEKTMIKVFFKAENQRECQQSL
jgi:hypothetical protein